MHCPNCGSENIKKNGIQSKGYQDYRCKDCGKSWYDKPVCPHCNSEDIIRSGHSTMGKITWKCKTCNKRFTLGVRLIKTATAETGITCPYCGGKLKYKGWNRSGSRRYICIDCGKGCSGERPVAKVKLSDIPCPYCGSFHVTKGGSLKDGTKRYNCKDCGKGFSEKTIVRPEIHLNCPSCNSDNIRLSGHDTKTGKQRYICRNCGRKFVENPTQVTFKVHEKTCPYCGHVGAKKGGKSSDKQYYICLSCNHKYLEGGLWQHTTKEKKSSIIQDYTHGMNKEQLSEKYGVSYRTINNVLRTDNAYKLKLVTAKLQTLKNNYEKVLKWENNKTSRIMEADNILKEFVKKFDNIPIKRVNELHALISEYKQSKESKKSLQESLSKLTATIKSDIKAENDKIKKLVELSTIKHKKGLKQEHINKYRNKFITKFSDYPIEIPNDSLNAFDNLAEKYMQDKCTKREFETSANQIIKSTAPIMQELYKNECEKRQEEKKKLACKWVMHGEDEKVVAEKCSMDIEYLKELVTPLYKKETLTPKQINTIIHFGVGAAVPVEYLAPYIPCSIKMCKKILSKYNIMDKKDYVVSEQEKNFDKIWLDRFAQ